MMENPFYWQTTGVLSKVQIRQTLRLRDLIQKAERISQSTISVSVLILLFVFTALSLSLTILEYGTDGKKRAVVTPEMFFLHS